MRIKLAFLLSLPLLLILFPLQTIQAQQGGLAVGVKAGTTGIGIEAMTSISSKFNGRLGGSFFGYSLDGIHDDDELSIRYDMDASITSLSALVDYFPMNRGLKLTAGLYYHDFLIDGDAVPNESYTIDDKTFSPEKLGSLSGKVDYSSKLVPYAGVGFGNSLADGSRLKFSFELGAMFTGSPQFSMDGEGMIAPTARQDKDLEEGMSDFTLYPVLNLSLSYRLF